MNNAMNKMGNHTLSNILSNRLMKPLHNSRGAAAVMVALTMTVLLAMGAAAIDIGHALVARNELQNVSDAAALAGTRALGVIYQGLTPAAQQTYTLTGGDQAIIATMVQTAANANSAAGVSITINAADIQIGLWDPVTRILTPTVNQPRAVRVISRRDGAANGPISTFLGNVVGMPSVNVGAVATAELTGVASTAPGDLDVPFGISQYYFTQFGCGNVIKFYPNDGTPEACAAWHTFDQSPANATTLRSIIDGMAAGTYESPATEPGFSLDFINGNVASAFPNLINLFNIKSAGTGYWDVFVPVYQDNDCSPPTGAIPIVGYATARITSVTGAPNFEILATIQCNIFDGAGGGGPAYGTFGTIPGRVE
jgi:Flp pilus assembly protein TadG